MDIQNYPYEHRNIGLKKGDRQGKEYLDMAILFHLFSRGQTDMRFWMCLCDMQIGSCQVLGKREPSV